MRRGQEFAWIVAAVISYVCVRGQKDSETTTRRTTGGYIRSTNRQEVPFTKRDMDGSGDDKGYRV